MVAVNKVRCKTLQRRAGTRQVIERPPASTDRRKLRRLQNHRQWYVPVTVIVLAVFTSVPSLAAPAPIPIRLGQSIVYLNGPWKFHTGDDTVWANPSFDDSTWES